MDVRRRSGHCDSNYSVNETRRHPAESSLYPSLDVNGRCCRRTSVRLRRSAFQTTVRARTRNESELHDAVDIHRRAVPSAGTARAVKQRSVGRGRLGWCRGFGRCAGADRSDQNTCHCHRGKLFGPRCEHNALLTSITKQSGVTGPDRTVPVSGAACGQIQQLRPDSMVCGLPVTSQARRTTLCCLIRQWCRSGADL